MLSLQHFAGTSNALARRISFEITTRIGVLLSAVSASLSRSSPPPSFVRYHTKKTASELVVEHRMMLVPSGLQDVYIRIPGQPFTSPDTLSKTFELKEACPACLTDVALEDIRRARCDNQHHWGQSCFSFDQKAWERS